MAIGIALIIIAVGGLVIFVSSYNSLISATENVNKAWSNIDVILKQRYDEIPQLIEICEQYVKYEKDQIDKIMVAREKMVRGKSIHEQSEAFSELTSGIKGLLAIGESYPELKSNQNFVHIQQRLSNLEESLADRRELYNDAVNIYNTRIKSLPDMFFATLMNMRRKEMFEVPIEQKVRPNLKLKI